MSAVERLIRYCQIDTQSDPANEDVTPSTEKQFDLARVLEQELNELGLEDVCLDEHCYVYAKLPGNLDHEVKTVGFIAHMDTAPDFSGTNVKPRIIRNFDGNDIALNDEVTLKMDSFPWMRDLKGKDLLVTDGNTLLGADDKAGITCIMEALVWIKEHPEFRHGPIAVAFTPDEEIGNGPKYFDVKRFDADFAYTMDGGTVRELADETFNAASAEVTFKGLSIHPGEAKDRMINAAGLAVEFAGMMPQWMRPEHTSGHEGFSHLTKMSGNTEEAVLEYILRDHDTTKLEHEKEILQNCADYIRKIYGENTVELTITPTYRNMKEIIDTVPYLIDHLKAAIRKAGIEPKSVAFRGGTDGSALSWRGLPSPNLSAGYENAHGRFEYVPIQSMEKNVEILLNLVQEFAK